MNNNNNQDWNSLPVELLEIILQLTSAQKSKVDLCNVALVCKAWMNIAQSLLYSNIMISTVSQFKKFYDTISYNPSIGIKVITLDLKFNRIRNKKSNKTKVNNILTSLLTTHLPNLEILYKDNLYSGIPTLYTILETQLKHLKILQQPRNQELEDYINCAFLMKDRLENLYVMCCFSSQQHYNSRSNLNYQRLYDKLYQFNNLEEIVVEVETSNGVQALEYIVDSCKSLKSINFTLATQTDSNVSLKEISLFVPSLNIKSLEISTYSLENDCNLLLYIMHKFPQLKSLSLFLNVHDPRFDAHLVAKLLNFVSTIDHFYLYGLSVQQSNLMETIGSFWEEKSTLGNEKFQIDYSDYCSQNMKTSLQVAKGISGREDWTILNYSTIEDFEWELFMDFVEKYGKFIGTLRFQIVLENDSLGSSELPESFFPHIFTYCPNLTNLQIYGCVLRQFIYSDIKLSRKFAINELRLHCCDIEPGMLEQLSVILHKINEINLYDNMNYSPGKSPRNEETTDDVHLIINTPYTDVNRIIFPVEESSKVIHVKVSVITDEISYYYQVIGTGQDYSIKSSTEKEFADKSKEEHVYFSCPTKPQIETKMLDTN